jgi:hypothetical protein
MGTSRSANDPEQIGYRYGLIDGLEIPGKRTERGGLGGHWQKYAC